MTALKLPKYTKDTGREVKKIFFSGTNKFISKWISKHCASLRDGIFDAESFP